jgi:hypothetical protein
MSQKCSGNFVEIKFKSLEQLNVAFLKEIFNHIVTIVTQRIFVENIAHIVLLNMLFELRVEMEISELIICHERA